MPSVVKEHARVYAGAYLVAGLFVVITLMQSFVAQFAPFKDYTHEQLVAVTDMQWAFAVCNSLISAGVVILAFLNQSLARANNRREGERSNTPQPFPTTSHP